MKIIKQDLKVYIYPSGNRYIDWYKNGKRHREDGPVEIWNDGREYFCIKSRYYLEDNYWKEVHENY